MKNVAQDGAAARREPAKETRGPAKETMIDQAEIREAETAVGTDTKTETETETETENAARDRDAAQEASERYHHGRLREALIEAAYALVREKGVEGFRVAEASRAAGVSSAAPYRHFRDRDEILGEVSARGFDALAERLRAARACHPPGSLDGLVALGQAYVRFVSADPEMFHLMWGTTRERFEHEAAFERGCACFDILLETVDAIRTRLGLDHLPNREFALPLWSGVHGLASLKLGERLRVVEDLELDAAVEHATRAYIAGMEALAAAERGEARN